MHHTDERLESQIDKGKLLLVNQEYEIRLGNGLDDVARTTGTYDQQPEYTRTIHLQVVLVRNLVAHVDAREGKCWGNWRMEWVASTLKPPPRVVYPSLLKPMRTTRLPAVDWTDAPTDLNGLLRFGERRILVSARVPSRYARAISEKQSYLLRGI